MIRREKMKLKKKTLLVLLGVSLLMVLSACAPKESKSSDNNTTKSSKITIGAMAAPDSAPLYVAERKGYFKDEGLNVKVELFKDPNKRDAAASAGQINAAVVDFLSFTPYMRSKKIDWKLITQMTGRFGIAVPKDSSIKTVKDLKGTKVANMSHQVTQYYMYQTLKEHGVNPDTVKIINTPQIPQRVEMIKNNQAAAAVLPQTFLTLASVQGCKVLTTSKPDFQVTALAAKGQLLKNKAMRTKFLKAYNQAVDDINNHPKDLQEVLQKDLSMPLPVVKRAPKDFPRYNQAKTPNVKRMKQVLKFADEQKIFTKKVNASDYIVPVD